MAEYLIAFNDEWVPDYPDEQMRVKSRSVQALITEMKAAGVFVFLGGLDNDAPVFSVDASSGRPLVTDGPFAKSKERLGGFAIVDVPDEEAARWWAEKVATACGWPAWVVLFALAVILPGRIGLGDATLAGMVALPLGFLGWDRPLVAVAVAYITAGVAGLIGFATRRLSRDSFLAFGPFILLGALVGALAQAQLPA